MSGKTKVELLAEIESLKQQLEIKDDYIKTLESLLNAEERDSKAFRAAHEAATDKVVASTDETSELKHAKHRPRIVALESKKKKREYLESQFIFYRRDMELKSHRC